LVFLLGVPDLADAMVATGTEADGVIETAGTGRRSRSADPIRWELARHSAGHAMERRASARNTSGFSDWGGASPQSSRAALPFPPDCERVRAFSRHARKGRRGGVRAASRMTPASPGDAGLSRLAALTLGGRSQQARAGPVLGRSHLRDSERGDATVFSPASWMPVGPAPCFWRFAGRVCLWSRDLHGRGCGTRIGLPRHFPHRFDAGGCGVSARRPLRHV
jgi:hypothetical protein